MKAEPDMVSTEQVSMQPGNICVWEVIAGERLRQIDRLTREREGTSSRQSAWLIEFRDMSGYFSPGYRNETWFWVWPDINEAVRFSRQIDAEHMAAHLRKFNTTFFQNAQPFAAEHIWMERR